MDGINYINGVWALSEGKVSFDNINPSNETVIGKCNSTTHREVDAACEVAKKAFKSWKALSRFKRSEYLLKVAELIEQKKDRLAHAISLETGKNYNESIAEVNEALHMAQYAFSLGRMPYGEAIASEISEKDSYMLRIP